ncbi:hypothetical protein WJ542_20480 [Paraburkholderia sp. B3]|uniref:hypothetical protein n=1 Tax=Paraburkholderia sp. B3 TaxID=3134791 RepID=UPI003981ACB4
MFEAAGALRRRQPTFVKREADRSNSGRSISGRPACFHARFSALFQVLSLIFPGQRCGAKRRALSRGRLARALLVFYRFRTDGGIGSELR